MTIPSVDGSELDAILLSSECFTAAKHFIAPIFS